MSTISSSVGGKPPKSDAGSIAEEFKGLTLEEFKEKMIQTFWMTYGHYRNTSGRLFFELYHSGENADGEPVSGAVVWRKGEVDGEVEEVILERRDAIKRYITTVDRGYTRVFKGITKDDIEKGLALEETKKSAVAREGLLGDYYKGKSFFRVAEYFEGLFSVVRGYDGMLSSGKHELSEGEVRFEIQTALDEGYVKEGTDEEDISYNPLAAFGVEIGDTKEIEEVKNRPKEGEFNADWLADMYKDDE